MTYTVRDGSRSLKFDGKVLATSSSKRPDSTRWIEFTLYKTDGGSYVLYRVGVSLVFHSSTCSLVKKYGLHEETPFNLSPESVPCDECSPTFAEPLVYPEQFRYWTLVTKDADAVLDALYKPGDYNERYLTRVARTLLEKASDEDVDLDRAYRVEFVE